MYTHGFSICKRYVLNDISNPGCAVILIWEAAQKTWNRWSWKSSIHTFFEILMPWTRMQQHDPCFNINVYLHETTVCSAMWWTDLGCYPSVPFWFGLNRRGLRHDSPKLFFGIAKFQHRIAKFEDGKIYQLQVVVSIWLKICSGTGVTLGILRCSTTISSIQQSNLIFFGVNLSLFHFAHPPRPGRKPSLAQHLQNSCMFGSGFGE